MRWTRRQLLLSSAALSVACPASTPQATDPPLPSEPAPERDPSPDPPEPDAPLDFSRFPWGVLIGDPTATSALASIHLPQDETAELVVQRYTNEWVPVDTLPLALGRHAANLQLDDLEPDTVYAVWARVDGVRSEVTRFRTAPDGDAFRQVRVAASSCFGNASPALANLFGVADVDPDVFLQLGDLCYTDGSNDDEAYIRRWSSYMERPALRSLVSTTAMISTWDDHEVDNNWTLEPGQNDSISAEQLEIATDVWREIIPTGPASEPVWRKLAWGSVVEFFVLDCRGERAPGQMLSTEQLDWVTDQLQTSTATFKVVLSSVHVTDHTALIGFIEERDRWQGYPSQRARLVTAAASVPGTLLVTGDMHFGAVQRVDAPGAPGEQLWEVAAGPSGSRLFAAATLLDGFPERPPQYDLVIEDWSFTEFVFDPGTRTVEVLFHGDAGTVLDRRTLELS